MLQFLSNYPWRYYLKTFFGRGRTARGALLVKEDRVSMLSPVGGELVFSSGLRELRGAPSLINSSRAGPGTEFRRKALADRYVNHSFEWVFVVDTPEVQIHQIDSLKYGGTRELTARRVMELVPSVLNADLAAWELVNSRLEQIEQETTPVSILLGLPKSVIKDLEGWSRHLRSTVSAILPLALVLLEQSITLSPTGFHVVLTSNHTVIARTHEGEIAQHPARFISSDLSSAELANEAKDFSIAVLSTSDSEDSDLEEIIEGHRADPIEACDLYRALCLVPPNPYH